MSDKLYINVYAVTRHYVHPAEGGIWENFGNPLASVPIKAKVVKGHDPDFCSECRTAQHNIDNGQPGEFCKNYPEDYDHQVEVFASELAHYDSLNYQSLDQASREPYDTRAVQTIEKALPEITRLIPEDPKATEEKKKELQELFADEEYGDIYSVRGGQEVHIKVEDQPAQRWPTGPYVYS